jgi:cytochrome c-type biogenesis protein CcsB
MATDLLSTATGAPGGEAPGPRPATVWPTIQRILRPLASLKLTVTLFAMGIFVILAGSVAQVDHDISFVLRHYFRTWGLAWIEWKIFVPRDWNVTGGFYFPGGGMLLVALVINLLAAHTVRFTVQARGRRLAVGIGAIAAAIGLTWLVIASGNLSEGIQDVPLISWGTLWVVFEAALAGIAAAGVFCVAALPWSQPVLRVVVGCLSAALGAVTIWLTLTGTRPDPAAIRILWQLVEGTIAGLALFGACWLVFKKRAGIVVIHAGIGLMMFNELFVYLTAVESQLRLREGEARNYTDDIRSIELAVTDRSPAKEDDTIVIPKSLLQEGQLIHDDRLPFDIQVVQFFENSELSDFAPGDKPAATGGQGLDTIPMVVRAATATDMDQRVDTSAAVVKLLKKGTTDSLGTYLVSGALDRPDKVDVGGKTYQIALRFKRVYKPYAVRLDETRKDDYMGTNRARNYSSDIHVVDRELNEDFTRHIKMNEPLRFAGDTFYQSQFQQFGDVKYSTLSVVSNRGWMIPYVACMIVVVGLLGHFLGILFRFVRRTMAADVTFARGATEVPAEPILLPEGSGTRRPSRAAELRSAAARSRSAISNADRQRANGAGAAAPASWASIAADYFPWIVAAIAAAWIISKAIPPSAPADTMNLYEFGKLPVMHEGRVKPLDSLARITLKDISDRQTYVDDEGHVHPAIEWFLDLVTNPEASADQKVFRIDSPDVLKILKLDPRPVDIASHFGGGKRKPGEGFRYSRNEIAKSRTEFAKQVELARAADKRSQTVTQKKILDLANRISAYLEVQQSFTPLPMPELPTQDELTKGGDAARTAIFEQLQTWYQEMSRFHAHLKEVQGPLVVPPRDGQSEWQPYATAVDNAVIERAAHQLEPSASLRSLVTIFDAYRRGDATTFNKEVTSYRNAVDRSPPSPVNPAKVRFEAFFNHFEPFYYGMVMYVTAFLLSCLGFLTWRLGWGPPLQRAAFWLMVVTLVLHSAALLARIYISGRPPVTSLYSAAVFIGWGGVLVGLVLELIFRIGIGNLVAAIAGFAALFVAHFLATSGDTFTVLEAVLDTQFWLATHVVCETLGYTTTFVAGIMGLMYIVLGVFTPLLNQPVSSRGNQAAIPILSGVLALATAPTGRIHFLVPKKSARYSTTPIGKALADMIYGVVCFAILFSFFGTVLGGLWADDSWGRFWGWDPKENGALIIVIWNALVLHARWDGMVKDRGLAVLAVGGNIAVAWSMFGVNELGAGLHSYGFTEGVALFLLIGVACHLVMIAIGVLPKRFWRSNRVAAVSVA